MLSINGFQTILFDLDGTLRYNRPNAAQTFLGKAIELGLPAPPESRRQGMRWNFSYWADSDALKKDLKLYEEDEDGFWLNYSVLQLEAFGCVPDQARLLAPSIHKFMAEEFDPEDFVPPEVPDTLAILKEAGFTLGVVSNRENPYRDYLEEIGLDSFFEFSIAAGEVQSWKPDEKIFQRALERAASPPERTIYVGDNYFADVLGARRVGIRPILVDPDQVFVDADCEVIASLDEIIGLLS